MDHDADDDDDDMDVADEFDDDVRDEAQDAVLSVRRARQSASSASDMDVSFNLTARDFDRIRASRVSLRSSTLSQTQSSSSAPAPVEPQPAVRSLDNGLFFRNRPGVSRHSSLTPASSPSMQE